MSKCEPDLLTRAAKGQKLTAEEHDENLLSIKESIALLCSDIDLLSSALREAGGLSESAAEDFGGSLSGINTRLGDVETCVDALKLQIGTLSQSQVDVIDACCQDLKGRVTVLESDISTAETNATEALKIANEANAESDTSGLQAQIDDIVNNLIVDLQSQIDALNTAISGLSAAIGTVGTVGSGGSTPPATDPATDCCTEFRNIAPSIIADQEGAGTDEQLPLPSTILLTGIVPPTAIAVQVLAVTESVADAGDTNESLVEVGPPSGTMYAISRSVAVGGT
jgi:hypothetical protein